jgi:hypothetical protein
MKISKIKHTGVNPDGTFKDQLGAVHTTEKLIVGKGKGCGLKGCHCSDGYWITIMTNRTENGVVEGLQVKFDNKEEYQKYLKLNK